MKKEAVINMKIDQDIYIRLKYFATNYENIEKKILVNSKKIYLGDSAHKTCRFCKKKEPEVSFKKFAHTISNLMGNKILGSNYECDRCNEKFSKILENHLASYLGFSRVCTFIQGKKGIPKYKKNNLKIMGKEKTLVIVEEKVNTEKIGQPSIIFDETKKEVTIRGEKDSYIPIQVYKAFVKMILSLIGKGELEKVNWAVEWISSDMGVDKYNFKELLLYKAFTPGPPPYENMDIQIYKRKDVFEALIPLKYKVPYLIMIIRYKNILYQSSIDYTDYEIKNNLWKDMRYKKCFPGAYTKDYEHGETQYIQENLAKKDLVKREPDLFVFKYDDINKEVSEEFLKENFNNWLYRNLS
ncbi:MAG: HNH endonuclease [Sarcina sp.]